MTPLLTVFTASVREDLARLWLACVVRAFPREETRIEIYDDSDGGAISAERLEGVAILRPGPGRRDFQEAYNDALLRASTPWLALIDTDAYAVSRRLWPRVRARLEAGAAAVACAPRAPGDDTVALFLDVAAYRAALADVPTGFLPRAEREEPSGRPGTWRGVDTGDLMARAVRARGGRIDVLPLEDEGVLIRFDALTNASLLAGWGGTSVLCALARRDPYLREGCLGNLALRRVAEQFLPDGPSFAFPVSGLALFRALASAPGTWRAAIGRALRLRRGARRLSGFLETIPPV